MIIDINVMRKSLGVSSVDLRSQGLGFYSCPTFQELFVLYWKVLPKPTFKLTENNFFIYYFSTDVTLQDRWFVRNKF
jgi:hypothetical protein